MTWTCSLDGISNPDSVLYCRSCGEPSWSYVPVIKFNGESIRVNEPGFIFSRTHLGRLAGDYDISQRQLQFLVKGNTWKCINISKRVPVSADACELAVLRSIEVNRGRDHIIKCGELELTITSEER